MGLLQSCGCADKRARRQAMDHRELAAHRLAETIRASGADATVVVLANPFTREKGHPPAIYSFQEVTLQGFRDSGLKVAKVAYPALKEGAAANPLSVSMPSGTTTPLSYLARTDAFDQIIAEHPDASVLISLIGLPANPFSCAFWQPNGGPPLALLLPDLWMIGDRGAIRRAFHSGRILAAVVRRPREWVPETGADAFDEHYLLVTAENIDEVVDHLPAVNMPR